MGLSILIFALEVAEFHGIAAFSSEYMGTYTLVLGCYLKKPFRIRFPWDLNLWKGIEALYPANPICVIP